jgi:hypothetical protein
MTKPMASVISISIGGTWREGVAAVVDGVFMARY